MYRIAFALIFVPLAIDAQNPERSNPPAVVSKCQPRYTDLARQADIQGTVVLYVEITPEGRVNNVKVLHPLGMGLDESAVDGVKHWRFKPGEKYGTPVTVQATIEVNFRLPETGETCPAPER
jgi:TonB family protein